MTPKVSQGDILIPSRELLGYGVGVQTSSTDLVGRHAYSLFWRSFVTDGEWEGGGAYAYRGLGNPSIGLTLRQRWDEDGSRLAGMAGGGAPDTLFVLQRERRASASMTFSWPTWRMGRSVALSAGISQDHFTLLDDSLEPATRYRLRRPTTRLLDYSVSASLSTARSPALQFGRSTGASIYLRARVRRELSLPDSLAGVAWADRSTEDVIGRLAAFVPIDGPGYSRHVLAARFTFAAARGAGAHSSYFDLGGASGSPENPLRPLALWWLGYLSATPGLRHR